MNLGAMIDLGVDPEFLRSRLSLLGLDHEYELRVEADSRKGIGGTRVDVIMTGHDHTHSHSGNEHAHEEHIHAHNHGHHHSDHDHGPEHDHDHYNEPHAEKDHVHHHEHRNLRDIERIITCSGLEPEVQQTALAMFQAVGKAEAKVHGMDLYEVHFHEVGATDSVVDIVGAAICYHALGVESVWASPVELGGGFVNCAHGMIPVPAPATVEILHGIPTSRGRVRHETATPTGAAIVATLAERFTETPCMTVEKTAYGIGQRDGEIPNVLRVHLADIQESPSVTPIPVSRARLLQCNIDDMTGEMLGAAMDIFMDEGAMDVFFTPIQMKKNRPATCLSLLCAEMDEERFKRLLFLHTTTLGIRSFPVDKTVLDRTFETLETPLGSVSMKNAVLNGEVIRAKPEFEDCRRIAREQGMSLADVYLAIGRVREK